ncbi:MAG TPA: hypothetical protein VML55_25490 [Planctomycetaceae bacterium]|nr:hypothetical protein [Planctomycetaceae bacterium]
MTKLLYSGNLPVSATAADLEQLFRQHGTVVTARVMAHPRTGRSLGFGFVEMAEGTEAAIAALHGTMFQGRSLTVTEAQRYSDEPHQDRLSDILDRFEAHYDRPESPEFRKVIDDLRELAETGHAEAAQQLADVLAFPGPYYDPEAAYKWYYIALSQQGYTVAWEDHNHTPPYYCGPVGDFRNESVVSELVDTLGWERVWQLDKEAEHWMAERNLTNRST